MTGPLSTPQWITLTSIALSVLALAIAGVAYTSYVDGQREKSEREADQRWCTLLGTLDEAYSTVPPTTELGRRVALAIHTLRRDLKC